jgi:prepilin-type N-terminal cleavage/methylation domain-containing protein
MKTSRLNAAFTLIELLVVISIIAILAGIALPVFSQVQERGAQTKTLSNGKQIGLACKLYATDHDGRFPTYTLDADGNPTTAQVSDANAAFAQLFPDYLSTESIFAVGKSAFTPNVPDEKMDPAGTYTNAETLKPGENHFAYVLNLTDTSNAAFPLIADGFNTTGNDPKYSVDETQPGGVWKGKKAVVIRVDTSGTIETVDRSTLTVVRKGVAGKKNMFSPDPTNGWLGASQTAVNPRQ